MTKLYRRIIFSLFLNSCGFCFLPLVQGQQGPLRLKTGLVYLNADSRVPVSTVLQEDIVLIQFSAMPDESTKASLAAEGIALLEYLPELSWYAKVKPDAYGKDLASFGVYSVSTVQAGWKSELNLAVDSFPEWARTMDDEYLFRAYYPSGFPSTLAENRLLEAGLTIHYHGEQFQYFEVLGNREAMIRLSDVHGIYWMEPVPPPVEANNYPGRINHRAFTLNMPKPKGRALLGSGVVIGEWDGAGAGSHVDYNDRMILKQPFAAGANGNHATHVAGTMVSGGIIDPFAQGMAPKASVFSWDFGGNIPAEMDTASRRDSIVMTNNSYGYGSDPCATRGTYDGISRDLDILVNKYPYLCHQFSSGNSRSSNCATGGYRTINSGFQAAKNNITVGALTATDGNSTFHSYGPMRDGRMKPEICAQGVSVYSTLPNNTYQGGWNGTSMSCPGATGTIALLHERFKQVNSNRKPLAHTLRAIVCNTCDDIGNTGPDYAFGFGRINGITAAVAIENNWWKADSIAHGKLWTDTVYVPSGTARFQVTLSWDDPPAAVSAAPSLVNDLDLEVTDSLGNVFRPWTLDPGCHTCLAVRKRDSLNNNEQFYVDNPASGKWVIRVKGTKVTAGKEAFTVSRLAYKPTIRVTYPNGLESFVPPAAAAPQTITWDAFGVSGTFSIDYSADSGSTWNSITTGLANTTRYFTWNNAPAGLNTRKALVRVKTTSLNDISDTTFHIYSLANTPQAVTCNKQIHLYWRRTPGAAGYQVLQSKNSFMEQIAYTTDTFYTVTGLNNGTAYWFSLQAVGTTRAIGPRTQGVSFTPSANPLPPSISTEPLSTTVCAGSTLSIFSRATGTAAFNRQWQYSSDSGRTWINLPGKISDTLSISNFPWTNKNYLYRNRYQNVCRNFIFTGPAKINVDTPVLFNNTLSDAWKCEGDSVAWTVNFSAARRPSLIWQRSTNNGATWTDLSSDTFNTLKIKNVVFAMNKYRYRMQASNFCESRKSSSSAVLNVRPPLRLLLPPDTTICFGAAIDLIANGTGGDSTRYIFNWTGFPAGNKIQVKPSAKKVYYVNLDDQCTNYDVQDSIIVQVRAPLALKLNNDTTLCNGRPVRLSASMTGGRSNTYQYLWTPGNLKTATITVAPSDTTRYRVRVTDGCTPDSAVGSVLVRVLKPLDLTLTRDTILCQGRGIFLNATPAGGRLSSRTVRWNQGLGTGWTKWIQPTSTTSYMAILSDGCSVKEDTALVTVQMRTPLMLTLNKDTTICAGTKANLYTKSGGGLNSGYLVQWNQGLMNGATHLVQPAATTTYRAVLSDGCTVKNDTQLVTVNVRPLLDVRLGNDTTLCYGNSITMNAISTGGNGIYSHRWEDKANPAVSLGSGSSLTAAPLSTITYRLILSDGCSVKNDTDELKVTVLPNLKLSTSPDTSICFGNSALLRSSVSGGKGSYTYNWTDVSTSLAVGSNAQLSSSPGTSRRYRIAVSDGCTANPPSAEIQVTVEALPSAAFILSDTTACAPATLQLRNNSVGVRFTLNGRRYSGADTLIKPNVGLTKIQLRAFNVLGCPDSFSRMIEVHPKPQAGFSYSPADPRELDMITFTDGSIGADNYTWELPHGSFFTPAVPGWSSKDTGSWLLRQIVSTNKGCSDTFSTWLRVSVGYFLQIPTAFTPNGDGLNDIWKPLTRGARNYELKVFNRWGQMVFSTNNMNQGWDGLNATEGVYVYTLSFVNGYDKRISEKGVITLMR